MTGFTGGPLPVDFGPVCRTPPAEQVELLLPRTDGAVLVEFVVVIAVIGATLALVWRRPDWRFLVASSGLLLVALMALRSMH